MTYLAKAWRPSVPYDLFTHEHKVNLEAEYSWFEFCVFLILHLLTYKSQKTQSTLHSWEEKQMGLYIF